MRWALLILATSLMFAVEAKASDVACGPHGCVVRPDSGYGYGYGERHGYYGGDRYHDRFRDRYFGDDRYGPHYPRRHCAYVAGVRVLWFLAAATAFTILMYSVAEILATRLTTAEEYTGALPVVAIIPFFFAGSLFPISALPAWLEAVAKVLPLTHALALFRYGLTPTGGASALHNIWGMSSVPAMAALSLSVLAVFTVVASAGAIRLFTKAGTS